MHRLLLLIGLLLSSIAFSGSEICLEKKCIAVMNAGYAGSRLHVYQYELDSSGAFRNIKNVLSKKIEPGLASVELNQAAIDRYLSLLFSDVPNLKTPVYVYATSGMRMLDFSVQQAYYAKLTQWFNEHAAGQLVVAKTLTSNEEALFGWLAVNYELGVLTSPTASLVGVVDTGSGSVQVAFPLQNVEGVRPSDYIDVNLYGRHVSLFTHGFLGLGQDQIRAQYLDSEVCFPRHYPLPNGVLGAGDFGLCRKLVTPLVNDVHQVDNILKSVIQRQPEQVWYVIGGISAMLQERPFMFEHNELTPQQLGLEANQQVCQQDWAVLGTLYQKNKYLFSNCLNASYFYSLFVDGLKISETQPIHFISNKVSTNDWTLGVVLFASSHLD